MNTKLKVKKMLSDHAMRVNELSEYTGVSKQMLHRALLELVEKVK